MTPKHHVLVSRLPRTPRSDVLPPPNTKSRTAPSDWVPATSKTWDAITIAHHVQDTIRSGAQETQTGPRIEMLGPESGWLTSHFANFAPRLKRLITRWKRGVYRTPQCPGTTPIRDSRGELVRRVGTLQTLLAASVVTRLVEDCLAGVTVSQLAESYGTFRTRVSAHPTHRDWLAVCYSSAGAG